MSKIDTNKRIELLTNEVTELKDKLKYTELISKSRRDSIRKLEEHRDLLLDELVAAKAHIKRMLPKPSDDPFGPLPFE